MNYKTYLKLVIISVWLSVSLLSCNLKKNESAKNDSAIDSSKKLEWFQEAKFGLFIHWGLYSVPAGEWNGRKNYGEWIQYSANIPGEEYKNLQNNLIRSGLLLKNGCQWQNKQV